MLSLVNLLKSWDFVRTILNAAGDFKAVAGQGRSDVPYKDASFRRSASEVSEFSRVDLLNPSQLLDLLGFSCIIHLKMPDALAAFCTFALCQDAGNSQFELRTIHLNMLDFPGHCCAIHLKERTGFLCAVWFLSLRMPLQHADFQSDFHSPSQHAEHARAFRVSNPEMLDSPGFCARQI